MGGRGASYYGGGKNQRSDKEFDIFAYLEENDFDEQQKPLQLTKSEQEMLDNPNAIYESNELMLATQGMLDNATAKQARDRYTKQIDEAEQMIKQRKSEGYKFDKDAAKARRELNRELAHEEGRVYIGEKGIRYWQERRKNAERKLKLLGLAEKIQKQKVT